MATGARRSRPLSRERIVAAATELLDAGGESALTFRALTTHLETGYGAVYHHVANKSDLVAAATDDVVAVVTAGAGPREEPREALRTLALGLFDAIDRHPWVGAQLSREPWRPAVLDLYETVGSLLDALGLSGPALMDAASALVNYVLGVAGQNAANARAQASSGEDRSAALAAISQRWESLDPQRYPFVRAAATYVREHDDREQFLAGVDLILTGIRHLP